MKQPSQYVPSSFIPNLRQPYRRFQTGRRALSAPIRHSDDNHHISVSEMDPSSSVLRRLRFELDLLNDQGQMSTYDREKGEWVPWERPVRYYSDGTMSLRAASGFRNVPGLKGPQCPHAANPFRLKEDTEMVLRKKAHAGKTLYYYQVPPLSHICTFVVFVPPLPRHIDPHLRTAEAIEEYCATHDLLEGDEYVEYSMEDDSLFASEVPSFSASDSTPSWPPSQGSSSSQSSKDRPLPRPLAGSAHKSFYNLAKAQVRASPDYCLITELLENERDGLYRRNKSMHPAAQLLEPPSILLPYDTRTDSGCLNVIHNHYQFFSTDIGRVIRELNSPLGVPLVTFHALLSHATTCGSCLCTFSVDGYNSHIRQGRCDNHPYMEKVSEMLPNPDLDLVLRTFPPNLKPPVSYTFELLDTPIGAPYLAFNSRLGVPKDVWIMVTTAHVLCDTCDLVRTFPSDREHRDADGYCMDVGQGLVGSIVRGKGKGKVVLVPADGSQGQEQGQQTIGAQSAGEDDMEEVTGS